MARLMLRAFGGFIAALQFDGAVFRAAAEGDAQRNLLSRAGAIRFDFGRPGLRDGGHCYSRSRHGYGSGSGFKCAEVGDFPDRLLA